MKRRLVEELDAVEVNAFVKPALEGGDCIRGRREDMLEPLDDQAVGEPDAKLRHRLAAM